MAEYYAGGIVYTVEVDDKSRVGVDRAKKGIDDVGTSAEKTDISLKTLSKETAIFGHALSSLGGTAMIAGSAIGGDLGKGLQSSGMGVAFLGSGLTTTVPALKALATVTTGQVVPAILKAVAALTAQKAALIALGSATVIGIAITGLYLLYQEMEKATSSSKKLEEAIDKLGAELDSLRDVESSLNYQTERARDEFDKSTKKAQDYRDALKDVRREIEDLEGTEKDLVDLSLDVESAKLDEKDAINEWKEAAARGDKDVMRYAINAATAQRRREKAEEEYAEAQKEVAELPKKREREKFLEIEAERAEKQRVKDQEEFNRKKEEEEKITDRIRTKDFQMKLLEWQKAGKGLTQEEYAAFTSKDAPEWMKSAIATMPKTVMQGPQFKEAAAYGIMGTGANILPGGSTGLPYYQKALESLRTKEVVNPLFKDIVIHINGTVTDQTFRIPGTTLMDLTHNQGY